MSTRCSETYETKTALISLFGVPLWYFSQSPRVAIQVSRCPDHRVRVEASSTVMVPAEPVLGVCLFTLLLRCKLEHADPQSTAQGICIKRTCLWTQEHSPSASRSPIAPSHLKGNFRCRLLVLLVFDGCRRGCLSCPVSDFTHFSGVSLTVRAGGPSTRRLYVALPRCFRRWNGWRRAGGVRRSPSPSACHTHGCSGDCRPCPPVPSAEALGAPLLQGLRSPPGLCPRRTQGQRAAALTDVHQTSALTLMTVFEGRSNNSLCVNHAHSSRLSLKKRRSDLRVGS